MTPIPRPRSSAGLRIQRAVDAGLERWRFTPADGAPHQGQRRRRKAPPNLERPIGLGVKKDPDVSLPMMRQEWFKVRYRRVLQRLLLFASAALKWYTLRFFDHLRGRDTVERQAVRLRRIVEDLGGTIIKVGQQMAMRVDLLPFQYGAELSKMLDCVPPFSTEYAVSRIEAQLECPLADVFPQFDRQPIGSASVACVYQAITATGEKVAIKVRRPGVGEIFIADCAALAVLLKTLEAISILREGFSTNFLHEFRTMLLEELDFIREARNTELFRRNVRRKLKRVTAPRVYFEYSGQDVLVTEYVEGVWIGELIAAVEHQDEDALARLREQNIHPHSVARRLIRTNQFGIFENLLFHADPHPSNVLVWPDGELVFIDFGACGAYTTRERVNWRQLAHYHSRADVGRMVQSALAILEPLPPIDIDQFAKRLEAVFWRDLYAFKSHHAAWWERTSARIWMSFLDLAREFDVPMNLNTLRMIRSTLLYETVAARLNPGINAYKEHHKYNRQAGKRARKRVRRAIHKRLFEGFTNRDYLKIEESLEMVNRAMYLFQRHLDTPPYRFSMLISKAVYTWSAVLRAVGLILVGGFVFIAAEVARGFATVTGYWPTFNLLRVMRDVANYRWFQVWVVAVILSRAVKVYRRMHDRDVDGDVRSRLT